ncbi:zinc finger domain-containing protein [Streptomyces hydrogenans]
MVDPLDLLGPPLEPLAHACVTCGAGPWEQCQTRGRKEPVRTAPHRARVATA